MRSDEVITCSSETKNMQTSQTATDTTSGWFTFCNGSRANRATQDLLDYVSFSRHVRMS